MKLESTMHVPVAVDEQVRELAAFEVFAKENFFDLDKGEHGYKSWPTRMAWQVWQETRSAARASQD